MEEIKLKKNSRQPLYMQLVTELKNLIRTKYTPGEQIPTEVELSERFGISRITVRKAIEQLCEDGYLVKRQGKGTFVESPKIHRKVEVRKSVSFSDACRAQGSTPTSHVLSHRQIAPESWQNSFLHLPDGEMLLEVRRIMSSDGTPIILQWLYLPCSRFGDLDPALLEDHSLYSLLQQQYGFEGSPACDSTLEADIADQTVASLLQMQPGEALLIMQNYQFDQLGQPAFISLDYFVGSRYRITI